MGGSLVHDGAARSLDAVLDLPDDSCGERSSYVGVCRVQRSYVSLSVVVDAVSG